MARTTRAARKPERPYHHGNLRRGLLDEALATIRTDGVDGLTLREIGARLGVSRTALYGISPTSARSSQPSPPKASACCASSSSPRGSGGRERAAFESMGMAYISFAAANPAHYRVMFGGFVDPKACDPELTTEAAGAFQALVDALAALQRDGVVRDDETVLMARHVWAVVHGIAMLGIDGQLRQPGSVEELTRYALERLRTGIAGRGDRHAREVQRYLTTEAAFSSSSSRAICSRIFRSWRRWSAWSMDLNSTPRSIPQHREAQSRDCF